MKRREEEPHTGASPEQHACDELHHDVLPELDEEHHMPSSSSSYGGPQSSIYLHEQPWPSCFIWSFPKAW